MVAPLLHWADRPTTKLLKKRSLLNGWGAKVWVDMVSCQLVMRPHVLPCPDSGLHWPLARCGGPPALPST